MSVDLEGLARNCDATDRTSLSASVHCPVRISMILSENTLSGMTSWSGVSQVDLRLTFQTILGQQFNLGNLLCPQCQIQNCRRGHLERLLLGLVSLFDLRLQPQIIPRAYLQAQPPEAARQLGNVHIRIPARRQCLPCGGALTQRPFSRPGGRTVERCLQCRDNLLPTQLKVYWQLPPPFKGFIGWRRAQVDD